MLRNQPTVTAKAAASAALALALLVGCGGVADDAVIGTRTAAIAGGHEATGLDAVGAVVGDRASGCTGTLITPSVVLTAGHCVVDAKQVDFYIGGLTGRRHSAAQVLVHPDFSGGNRADIALLKLDKPVLDVKPIAISRVAPKAGQAITLVGYGKVGEAAGAFGTKRKSFNTIGVVRNETFTVFGNANICDGDSGGPSLRTRDGSTVVVGVHSTKSGGCGVQGNDMRVDVFAGWIDRYIARRPAADTTAPELLVLTPAPNSRAPNAFTAAVATFDDTGVRRVTFRVDGTVLAAMIAPPWEAHLAGLAFGDHELRVTAEDKAGNLTTRTVHFKVDVATVAAPFGAECNAAADCASSLCVAGGVGGRFCSRSCQMGASDACPNGYNCVDGTCKLAPLLSSYGARCDTANRCASGLCLADITGSVKVCSRGCDAQRPCTGGARCLPVKVNGAPSGRWACVLDLGDDIDADAAAGCSAGGRGAAGAGAALPLGLLLVVGIAAARRRRRKR